MIVQFEGRYRFLSNFYPILILFEDIVYPSVEHAYQAAKTVDIPIRKEIAALKTAGKAKQRGSTIQKRSDWDEIKHRIMYTFLCMKFSNPILKRYLLATGDTLLIEGNTWHDNYWGVCECIYCRAHTTAHNYLGKLLMQVRLEILTKS